MLFLMGLTMSDPKLGEIWLVNFNPTKGHEQAGMRPCLIISVDEFNSCPADLVIAIPITSKFRNIPTHVPIVPPEGGLRKKSYILCEQIRSISKDRLKKRLGKISYPIIRQAKDRIALLLGLY
jgi:mRNA interferase MazF